jgi:hypothetical protein
MFEVIISSVVTGRVQRRLFDSQEQAVRYVDQQQLRWSEKGRSSREYRVEVHAREVPVVRRRVRRAAPDLLPAA